VARQLIESGTVKRAWLGVSFQEITPELAAHFGGSFDGGALINAVVPEGPADKAGLRAGDVITAVGDHKIREGHDLLRTVLRHGVDERLTLEVRRGDKTKKVTLVTGERPSEDGAQSHQQGVQDDSMLGLALEELTPRLRERFRYEGDGRVFIRGVAPGSDADRAGLRPGDIILQADRQPVRAIGDVRTALKDGKAVLYVERESRRFFQAITRSE
jgi:S1-C subfamily serine protease